MHDAPVAGGQESALRSAAALWDRVCVESPQPGQVSRVLAAVADAFIDSLPPAEPRLQALEAAHQGMIAAWRTRFARQPFPAVVGDQLPLAAPSLTADRDWVKDATVLTNELLSKRVALTSGGRLTYRGRMAQNYRALIERLPAARLAVRLDAWTWRAEHGGAIAADAMRVAMSAWRKIPTPPAPIGEFLDPVDAARPLVTGPGPVRVYAGQARPSVFEFTTTRPGDGATVHQMLPVPDISVPVVLDLDAWGGFLTDDASVVESATRNLLAALPGGQLQIRLFDPQRLGESANFLYGLGDDAARIIGDKVKTTPKELADLLVETEEHITIVTQKYLQGAFDSLTEYNVESQDVTEPYRLLILFDFPHGFSRDHNFDREQFDRLARIVTMGRRCGVYVMLVGGSSAREGVAASAVEQLPHLLRHQIHPQVAAYGLRLPPSDLAGWSSAAGLPTRIQWEWQPPTAPTAAIAESLLTHVQRGLNSSDDIQVDPARVAELARRAMERDTARGIGRPEPVADPQRSSTWWQSSSLDGVRALVGRLGAQDIATVELDSKTASSVLIGGRPGSGKSVLLHSLILNLVQTLAPDELELYLVDFKEGVEFKQYATYRLPHARVVAIESEREFGVSVLEAIADEIVRRGRLFRDSGSGEETNIGQYRTRTGEALPRLVLIVDEFQVLFDRDDKIGARAAELLERILRTGRAFGVHAILASQTLAGMPALGRHLHNLIPTRISLQVAEADSRLLLGEDNPDARLLSRPGEALLNTRAGARDANQRFQTTYWSPEQRALVLDELHRMAGIAGVRRSPIVFEGQRKATVEEVDPQEIVGQAGSLTAPLGTPMRLGPLVQAEFRREPGGNLLVLVDEPDSLAVALPVLMTDDVTTTVIDFAGDDGTWPVIVKQALADGADVINRRGARDSLAAIASMIAERHALHDYSLGRHLVVLGGLHRARDFEPSAEYDDGSESALLKLILKDGPEVGVHVVAWVDKRASLERRMSAEALREFGLRLVGQMSRDDSMAIVDSDDAATLKPGQGLFEDVDRNQRVRLRMFACPGDGWLATVRGIKPS